MNPDVRSLAYFIVHTVATCERCDQPTGLVGVGIAAGHECYIDDEWVRMAAGVWLFHVEWLLPAVADTLQDLAPQFRLGSRGDGPAECWLNHCQQCNAPQDDYWLYCEPGGAFLPDGGWTDDRFDIIQVDAPFSASASGFAEATGALASTGSAG